MAIIARAQTGEGQYIDTSLIQAAVSLSIWESSELWATGRVPKPLGSGHRANAPYQAVKAKDGYLTIGINNEHFWQTFCGLIECDCLLDDPRFNSNPDRLQNIEELIPILEGSLSKRTVAEWLKIFLDGNIPAGPILNYAQSLGDPHIVAREMVQYLTHPVEGIIPSLGIPAKLSATPGSLRTAAPLLGQHTEEILRSIGYEQNYIDQLIAQGSVFPQENMAAKLQRASRTGRAGDADGN